MSNQWQKVILGVNYSFKSVVKKGYVTMQEKWHNTILWNTQSVLCSEQNAWYYLLNLCCKREQKKVKFFVLALNTTYYHLVQGFPKRVPWHPGVPSRQSRGASENWFCTFSIWWFFSPKIGDLQAEPSPRIGMLGFKGLNKLFSFSSDGNG